MRYEIYIVLALAAVVCAQKPAALPTVEDGLDRTLFNLTTFTLIRFSTTTTSTLTSTTTCTTSTAALTTCTAGRRRRGLFYDDAEASGRNRRGLFYNDDEETAFLRSGRSDDPKEEVVKAAPAKETLIPLQIQSGFSLPEGISSDRFLLAIGTTTITSYIVTTSTSSLTARCSSTTGFGTCGASG